jgi:hypothetical protein
VKYPLVAHRSRDRNSHCTSYMAPPVHWHSMACTAATCCCDRRTFHRQCTRARMSDDGQQQTCPGMLCPPGTHTIPVAKPSFAHTHSLLFCKHLPEALLGSDGHLCSIWRCSQRQEAASCRTRPSTGQQQQQHTHCTIRQLHSCTQAYRRVTPFKGHSKTHRVTPPPPPPLGATTSARREQQLLETCWLLGGEEQ